MNKQQPAQRGWQGVLRVEGTTQGRTRRWESQAHKGQVKYMSDLVVVKDK